MTATDATTDTSSSTVLSDCSAFLNWHYNRNESDSEKAVIFQSLVATMKSQPAFDVNLEAKALKFLKSVDPVEPKSADAFLSSHGRTTDESLTHFIQSMVVLISSTSQTITTAAMKMLFSLLLWSSEKVHLSLIKADLIPQLIIALNPHSLSFTEAVDIHINLMKTIRWFVARSTPHSLAELGIQDLNEQQAVHETVFQQVFLPSETYICHLCMNRFSIFGRKLSDEISFLLPAFVQIHPYYQPTMDFILNMPVFLTIPSCLTFFEIEHTIWNFLNVMNITQQDWNRTRGDRRQMWKTVHRMLRMEGIEDVIEERLRNDRNGSVGRYIVADSKKFNNLLGMNHLFL